MQSSDNIAYKCCKTKPFMHYVCVKCHSIYHKSCVPKFKKQIRFVKLNKIICCEDDLSYSELDEKSTVLEKTINDLTEDSEMKNKHIQKLKTNNKLILDEALQREEELNELLERRERIIHELKQYINELEKTIADKIKTTTSISTQTRKKRKKVNKTTSASTAFPIPEAKDIVQEHIPLNSEINQNTKIELDKLIDAINKVSENSILYEKNALNNKHKKQILVLCDEIGTNIHWHLRKKVEQTSYEVTVIRKPGALLHQVMDNIESLTKKFTLEDFVVVMGGSNDILDNNSVPSFGKICNKLKQCTNTNVMFTSVIYSNAKSHKNKYIFKYNQKLNDFLYRFNGLVKGRVEYIEINNRRRHPPCSTLICNLLINSIFAKTVATKNLKFINVLSDVVISSASMQLQNNCTLNPIPKDNEEIFLYPRLSQVSLINI